MDAFLLSFGVIFVAELGDKSQLMALAFATRFPALAVLVAITIATAIIHLASVAVGATVALLVPPSIISIIAGLAFVGFGVWTWRGDVLSAGDEERATRESTGSGTPPVGAAFFLPGLGGHGV